MAFELELSSSLLPSGCQEFAIPAGNITYIDGDNETQTIQLTDAGLYLLPGCKNEEPNIDPNIFRKDPFYGSVTPIAYTAAATTVMAWLLFILLFLSQKRRPWLQKIALLLVAVSLTTGLAETTNLLQEQYNHGYQDADELRSVVFYGLTFRILQVISGLVLWTAHVQVVLRLYGSEREKLFIRVLGGVLIFLNLLFIILSDFYRPIGEFTERFENGFYVVSMLSEIILITLYAAAVLIYSFSRYKYAYKRSVVSIAVISISASLAPLAFTIVAMVNYWMSGWASLAQRACNAAATVVVWDWIDAIERLQLEEQKKAFIGKQLKNGPKMTDDKPVFGKFRDRNWVVTKGADSGDSDTFSSKSFDQHRQSPPTVNLAELRMLSPRSDDTEEMHNDLTIHHHPTKRNNLRMNTIAKHPSRESMSSPSSPMPQSRISEAILRMDDQERPPDFFAPVHGFTPGDYFDDKAPLVDEHNSNNGINPYGGPSSQ